MIDVENRLIDLIQDSVKGCRRTWAETIAGYLLSNGVVVLPPTTKEIIKKVATLKYNEGKTVKEIAYEMSYSDRQVFRYLKKFREVVKK